MTASAKQPKTVEVYNATTGPVFVDDESHAIGGGQTAEVEKTDQVKALLESGDLVEVGSVKPAKEPKVSDDDDEPEDEVEQDPSVTVTTVPPPPPMEMEK